MWPWGRSLAGLAVLVLALGAGAYLLVGARAHRSSASAPAYHVESVTRRTITQTVEATGTVEPVEIAEIKSKASGQILRLPVEIGSVVAAGQLLAQIDTVNVQNQYDEAAAALQAAQASVEVTGAQRRRAGTLFARGLIAAEAHETAMLAGANAVSALAKARADLEIARQALADATVRAPSDGTVIERDVTRGQVIASATASASGGTTLFKLADLRRVQLRVLVSETDIGVVRAGLGVTVSVDAYPAVAFHGTVIKVEPQAVVKQSVTTFPVLVAIANERGLLLPGMNGEVTIVVAHRAGALAVPIEAVRSRKDLATSAAALGLEADALGRGLDTAGATAVVASAGGAAPASTAATQFVFVRTAAGVEARAVRLGVGDDDWSEVLSGLGAGEQVVLVGMAEAQAERSSEQSKLRERMGSMPGLPGGATSAPKAASPPAAGGK